MDDTDILDDLFGVILDHRLTFQVDHHGYWKMSGPYIPDAGGKGPATLRMKMLELWTKEARS